ncbi:hypothetical protein [Alcanivorax quisquiliarum]|uniref:DUF3429 domain-containing protein n=1 Tax=Alcanivorax quisquiliarum TaxID=2933565 RepID=A0ABT0E6V6_9GAMM|nr:hypothetical protein [Alcanivorax quisquiliarum]MCK0537559.1 hypothetical protein [Alcanivorax quisquiliarum]
MRLETGTGSRMPARAVKMMRMHYALVLLAVLAGMAVWVPVDSNRAAIAAWACMLATAYLWHIAGLYCAGLFHEEQASQPVGGFGVAMAVPLLLTLLAWSLPLAFTVLLLLLALVLSALLERLPSHRSRWPAAWLNARRQQSQLLAVALGSLAVALWTVGQTY